MLGSQPLFQLGPEYAQGFAFLTFPCPPSNDSARAESAFRSTASAHTELGLPRQRAAGHAFSDVPPEKKAKRHPKANTHLQLAL